jgi:hypothetical protein
MTFVTSAKDEAEKGRFVADLRLPLVGLALFASFATILAQIREV